MKFLGKITRNGLSHKNELNMGTKKRVFVN